MEHGTISCFFPFFFGGGQVCNFTCQQSLCIEMVTSQQHPLVAKQHAIAEWLLYRSEHMYWRSTLLLDKQQWCICFVMQIAVHKFGEWGQSCFCYLKDKIIWTDFLGGVWHSVTSITTAAVASLTITTQPTRGIQDARPPASTPGPFYWTLLTRLSSPFYYRLPYQCQACPLCFHRMKVVKYKSFWCFTSFIAYKAKITHCTSCEPQNLIAQTVVLMIKYIQYFIMF